MLGGIYENFLTPAKATLVMLLISLDIRVLIGVGGEEVRYRRAEASHFESR